MTRTFVIPYSYKQGDKVLTRYFVNYEPETQVYAVLDSASETDFEYVEIGSYDTLPDAVRRIETLLKGKTQ